MPLTGSRRSPPTPSSRTVRAVLFDQHHIPQLAGASHPTVQDSQARRLCSWPQGAARKARVQAWEQCCSRWTRTLAAAEQWHWTFHFSSPPCRLWYLRIFLARAMVYLFFLNCHLDIYLTYNLVVLGHSSEWRAMQSVFNGDISFESASYSFNCSIPCYSTQGIVSCSLSLTCQAPLRREQMMLLKTWNLKWLLMNWVCLACGDGTSRHQECTITSILLFLP